MVAAVKVPPWQRVPIPSRHPLPWPASHGEGSACRERGLEDQTPVTFPGPTNNLKRERAPKIDPRVCTARTHRDGTAAATLEGALASPAGMRWTGPGERSGTSHLLARPPAEPLTWIPSLKYFLGSGEGWSQHQVKHQSIDLWGEEGQRLWGRLQVLFKKHTIV